MTQLERLVRALTMQTVDRPPAAVPTQNAVEDIMTKSGYSWPSAQKKAKDMAGLAWACHEIGGIESVRVPFDINVEAEAMGCETRFGNDPVTPPMTTPKSKDEYTTIRYPDPLRDGRMPEVVEAVRLLRDRAGNQVPVIAALGTPFELLTTTMTFDDITELLYEDPGFLLNYLEQFTGTAKRYAEVIEEAGPDVLMLVDGTSQTLGPAFYGRFSFPFTKKLIASLKKPVILHICGNATPLLEQMIQTGATALSIDKPVDHGIATALSGGRVALVGKISPQVLCMGSPEEVVVETEESLAAGMQVIAPGCGILPQTPLENVRAYIDTVIRSGRIMSGDGYT